jgi:hypothetical protein
MKIPRKSATEIMSAAASEPQRCLLGVIDLNSNDVYLTSQVEEAQALMQKYPGMPLIYNQHEQAITFIEKAPQVEAQCCIEVFQEIEGVFGLRAYRQHGKIQMPEEMELQEIAG